MSSRAMILERLNSATWTKPSSSREVISTPASIVSGDVEMFVSKATAAGAQVEEVGSLDEVQNRLVQIVQEEQLQKIVITDEENLKEIDWEQLSQQTKSQVQSIAQLPGENYRSYVVEAGLGVTGCKYALAETGTVVLEHSHSNERLVSHAPDHYVCIVKRDQILKDRYVLASLFDSGLSSTAWTLVTGVSRTADVALQVVLGMHGPRKVTIFVVG
ncbi:MAG: LUD domain-containing protein [Syntrophomonadaceae bacterium]|jgi:L-lactate dehydrogenase complex protein LldG|nr:LUD domain-containing protein [Bacillota bacterium]NLP23751.1 LUD domain-containing protein [Syntrophomonadaceae bacterium]